MSNLPQVNGWRLFRALLKKGFYVHSKSGSHVTLKHRFNASKRVTISIHKSKAMGKGILHKILEQAGISVEELRELL